MLAALVGGCGPAAWRPPTLAPPPAGRAGDTARRAFARQYDLNRDVLPAHLRRVTVLVMLPAYDTLEQLRAGNMGHAAIEFDGRLHDVGSLNGYAFTFRPSTGVPFWPWRTADAAAAALVGHPDCDGWLDELTRFDVTVTDDQVRRLAGWWAAVERRMADRDNKIYFWANLQCASCVALSLRAAGITFDAPLTPADLAADLKRQLRHTAGAAAGTPATVTVVQPKSGPAVRRPAGRTVAMLLRWPALLSAGRRSPVLLSTPDGAVEPILWSDGPAYRDRVGTFAVAPEAAVRRAGVAAAQCVPDFAVGRWYHVAIEHVIGQAAVGGPWVNGDTGAVVTVGDGRVVRFDAFLGDRLVAGRKCERVGKHPVDSAGAGPIMTGQP